jgi:predicted PurR-regulated permease PerM
MEQGSTAPSTTWPPRRVALATLVVLAIAGAFWIVIQFRLVFFSLFIAVVLSTAIAPLVDRITRLGIPRSVSIIFISLIFLALAIAAVVSVVPLISNQWITMTNLLGQWYESLYKSLVSSNSLILLRLAAQLPSHLFGGAPSPAPPTGQPSPDLAQQALNMSGSIMRTLILGISVLLLTGLWILEGETATRFLLMALPTQQREPAQEFLGDIQRKVGAYTRGLALLTLVVGVLAGIAYAIIGLPNVLFLGVFAGLMEIVPLIGPLLGAIPAVLVASSAAPDKLMWVILAYIVIQAAEGHLIVPRIMDRTVGVNPVASLLAFIAFGSVFGFLGALLAVPLAAVIQLVLKRFIFEVSPMDQSPPTGRDSLSTLRYEAQDLVMDVRKQIRDKETELSAHEDRIEDSMETIATDLDSILAQAETDQERRSSGDRRSPNRTGGRRAR